MRDLRAVIRDGEIVFQVTAGFYHEKWQDTELRICEDCGTIVTDYEDHYNCRPDDEW